MTDRVDFYVLKSPAARQRWEAACRLAELAYRQELRVVILSDSAADAHSLDELLWTYDEDAFLPHQVCLDRATHDPGTRVHLTDRLDCVGEADLLINLSHAVPPSYDRFARIAEIMDADAECRRLGRERFKTYRDRKLPLATHQLDSAAALRN